MSYDGSVLRALVMELKEKIIGGRIDKIYQINSSDIVLKIRNNRKKYKLLISTSNNSPKIYLTEEEFNNPSNPPAFCMLLRKHLEGFKILDIDQYKMDRILRIDVLSKNELADEVEKSLFVEIMGKHSNIILTDKLSLKIFDSIKRVNTSMSRVRQILPGMTYNIESISNSHDPLVDNSFENCLDNFDGNKSIKKNLMKNYTGISPLIGREISYIASIDENRPLISFNDEELKSFKEAYYKVINKFKNNDFVPTIILDSDKIIDFSSIDLNMYPKNEKRFFNSISTLLEYYYTKKENNQIIQDKSSYLSKVVKNNLDKEVKKLNKLKEDLENAKNREKYKIYGDLISSNFYNIESGIDEIELENFYDNMNKIIIPLDRKISAYENANKYYKKYSKLKTAAKVLQIEIKKTKSNIDYLKNQLLNIELSQEENDFAEIREELEEENYIKKNKNKNNKKNPPMKFLEYTLENGDKIYCGKNNKQNEYLTFKLANREDLWFHVKDASGSHVILKNENNNFNDISIEKAAKLAALNSSLKNSDNILVDFTHKKFVKRHPSKRPGLVTYTDFNTINVKINDMVN